MEAEKEILIYIIIVNYNDWKGCVLFCEKLKNREDIQIVISDNKSRKNEYYQSILQKQGNVDILNNEYNGGYSYGNNRGYEYIKNKLNKEDLVIISNSDIHCPNNFFDDLKIVNLKDRILFPTVLNNNGEPQDVILGVNPNPKVKINLMINKIFPFYNSGLKHKNESLDGKRFSGSGCFIIMNADVAEKIFLLDENIFLYNEEILIGLKAIKNNINCFMSKELIVLHEHSKTTNQIDTLIIDKAFIDSEQYVYDKYYNAHWLFLIVMKYIRVFSFSYNKKSLKYLWRMLKVE